MEMWMEIRKNKILIEIIMENGDGNMEIVKTVMEKMTVSLKNYQHCKELRLESLYFGGSPTTHLVFPTESICLYFWRRWARWARRRLTYLMSPWCVRMVKRYGRQTDRQTDSPEPLF